MWGLGVDQPEFRENTLGVEPWVTWKAPPPLGRRNVVNVQEWLSLQERKLQIRKVS